MESGEWRAESGEWRVESGVFLKIYSEKGKRIG